MTSKIILYNTHTFHEVHLSRRMSYAEQKECAQLEKEIALIEAKKTELEPGLS